MNETANQELTNKVEEWWNSKPFAYGIANTKRDQVDTIPLDQMDLAYFQEIERRFRKHSAGGGAGRGPTDPVQTGRLQLDKGEDGLGHRSRIRFQHGHLRQGRG